MLAALVEHRERVVGKDELLALAWPGLVVEENNLTVQVSALRKVLGAAAIATVPGRGYRFTLPVRPSSTPRITANRPASPWLTSLSFNPILVPLSDLRWGHFYFGQRGHFDIGATGQGLMERGYTFHGL